MKHKQVVFIDALFFVEYKSTRGKVPRHLEFTRLDRRFQLYIIALNVSFSEIIKVSS